MGHESARYFVTLAPDCESEAVLALQGAGAELRMSPIPNDRTDLCLRDVYRYWIDLRIHRQTPPRLEVRIALTNDQWVLRPPLERALGALVALTRGQALCDEAGAELAAIDRPGWSLELEQHYGTLRDAFTRHVGDFTAPIPAEHVYMYVHQTRRNRNSDEELAWHREREIARMQEMWETGGDEQEPRA